MWYNVVYVVIVSNREAIYLILDGIKEIITPQKSPHKRMRAFIIFNALPINRHGQRRVPLP